jgi:uncharacterized protein YoxC
MPDVNNGRDVKETVLPSASAPAVSTKTKFPPHWAGTWWYGVLVAVAAFLVGLFGAVWNDAIKDAFPFCCWLDFKDTLHWHRWTPQTAVYVFWGSAFAWLVFFIFRQLSESKSIELLQKSAGNIALEVGSVHEQVGEITTSVGTLKESTQKVVSEVSFVQSGVKEVSDSVGIVKANAQQIVRDVNSVNSRVNEVTVSASEIKKDTGEVRKNLDEAKTSTTALQNAVDNVTGRITKIGDDLQTLPPPNFRQELVLAADNVHTLLNSNWPRSADNKDRQTLIDAICSMLEHMARMVAHYSPQDKANYGADVMFFWETSSVSPEEIKVSRRYRDASLADGDIDGFLVLDGALQGSVVKTNAKTLTGTVRHAAQMTVDDLRDTLVFAIPDPDKSRKQGKWIIAPVAPVAFVSGNFYGWPDTRSFSSLKASPLFALEDRVIEELERYHRGPRGSLVASVYSFPLIFPDAEMTATVFGTLNLHCDKPNMFSNETQSKIFTSVTTPLINQISEACYLKWRLKRDAENDAPQGS